MEAKIDYITPFGTNDYSQMQFLAKLKQIKEEDKRREERSFSTTMLDTMQRTATMLQLMCDAVGRYKSNFPTKQFWVNEIDTSAVEITTLERMTMMHIHKETLTYIAIMMKHASYLEARCVRDLAALG